MVTGESWKCPHCGERILRTALVCPACQRRLQVKAPVALPSAPAAVCPLRVEGIIPHPGGEAAWEYSVLVEVCDQKGAVLARRVVGVGAIQPGESRQVTLSMEMRCSTRSAPGAASPPPKAE